MCQYSAIDGVMDDHHFVHYSQFAMGGTGLIIVEATGVEARGRIPIAASGSGKTARSTVMNGWLI